MEKIGILGSAVVGQTLARGFQSHGYDVRIGSRTPAKLAEFSSSTGIRAATFGEVASWADVIVLAVHGSAAEEALLAPGQLAANVGRRLNDAVRHHDDADECPARSSSSRLKAKTLCS